MKLLFVIESLHMGGAEKSLVTLLQHLPEKEYSIDLLTFREGGELASDVPEFVDILHEKIQLSLLDRILFKILKLIKNPKHDAQLFRRFALKNLPQQSKNYDVAIAYNQGLSTYYVSNKVTATKKIAWINVDYQKAEYEIVKDISFFKKFNHIVTVSPPAYDSFVSALKQIKITDLTPIIIKDITDSSRILKQAEAFDPEFDLMLTNLVTVGRLAKPKGYPLALEAAKRLKNDKVKFHWHIIGEGPERSAIESLIIKYDLSENITLYGNQSNPYPYIKHADIYVQPSLFEGLGLTIIEATILKKPIVCTNFPTAHQIIKNGETGIICETDSFELSNAILKLIKNQNLQQKFSSQLESSSESDKIVTLSKFNQLLHS